MAEKTKTDSPPFNSILEIFDRPVDRHIEEVIKVDQVDVDVVRGEIEEYVPTDSIKAGFERILERYAETPNHPHEGIGIWISGFFGSGKSSFAKILGYILENRSLGDATAAELFARQAAEPKLEALLTKINATIPTKSIIFDVSTDAAVNDSSEKLTDIVYRILLRELDYPMDAELAELEIDLERQDRLETFKETFAKLFEGTTWDEVKHYPATARNKASHVLHELEPDTYPAADTWARTPRNLKITANLVVKRCFELAQRRADSKALFFVIDEVGQYVARSTAKMLDLQGLIQALGREGRNRADEWKGQVWLVATSQERLSEVVDNLEGKQVELARLRDRFQIEIDLAPSDIREVTSKRVLRKKPSAAEHLASLYEANSGKLREATRVTGRLEGGELNANSFAELYPFLPYQVPLLIDIVHGLRTQGGASRHVGGSNRTIIKQAQQVLINDRTDLGSKPVGRLVTLDQIYELLEGMVTNERRRDVHEIEEEFGADAQPTRVAKALALLQFVGTFPRTPENIAAALHPAANAPPAVSDIEQAIEGLRKVSKVRETDSGWELLSRVGKDWEEERRGIDPLPRDRSEILRDTATQVFDEVSGYRHRNIRTFNVLPVVNGQRLGRSGDVELNIRLLTGSEGLEAALGDARKQSNTDEGRNALHWIVALPDELVHDLDELHRSREMFRRHERDKLSQEEGRLLSDEKTRSATLQGRVTGRLKRVFQHGEGFLRGIQKSLAEHGDDLPSIVRGALQEAVPKLYEKFDLAAVPVRSGDAAKVLESESLAGLPAAYYDGEQGLGLVRRQGGEQKIDTSHPAFSELLDFIKERRSYHEDPSGRTLEDRFTRFGYGWDLEVVKLLGATALRASLIEVYSGRRFTSYAEAGVQDVFRKTNAFRAAKFGPRQDEIDIATLTEVTEALEQLYGGKVALEEGAITAALHRKMPEEANLAHRVLALLEANELPGTDSINTLHGKLQDLGSGSSQDTIVAFHGQLDELREGIQRVHRLEKALAPGNLQMLRGAKEVLNRLWPQLQGQPADVDVSAEATALTEALASAEFDADLAGIGRRAARIREAYDEVRANLVDVLDQGVRQLFDEVRNRPEWESLSDTHHAELEAPFERVRTQLAADATSLSELATLQDVLPKLAAEATVRLLELHAQATRAESDPLPAIRRLEVRRFASEGLSTEDDVKEMLDRLREACLEAIAKGETVILQ